MKKSKWPDFLFTVAVRLLCGGVFGGLVCLLLTAAGILKVFSRGNTHVPLIWLGLWGLAGSLVAVFTVPRWQTPWYRRDKDELCILTEMGPQDGDGYKPGSSVVKRSVSIKTIGEDGEQHEYSSMDEVPPEIRAGIESLEREVAQEKGKELSVTETSQRDNTITTKVICRKDISVYKIIDESGVERTYHSLEEVPPEIRAAIAKAVDKPKA
jgi:hypothetical protein